MQPSNAVWGQGFGPAADLPVGADHWCNAGPCPRPVGFRHNRIATSLIGKKKSRSLQSQLGKPF